MNVFAVLLSLLLLSNCPASASSNDVQRAFGLYSQSSRSYNNPKKHAAATAQINEALRMFPENSLFLFQKALCLSVSEEEDDAALKYLDKALSISPKLGAAWNLKAEILLRNKKTEQALLCADKALKYDATWFMTRPRCLQKMERFPEALRETDVLLRKHPSDTLLLSLHADLSRQAKHWQAVIDDTTKLLRICDPKTHSYQFHLKARGKAYIETHQDAKALLDLEAAAKRTTLDREIYTDLLEIYKRKKDLKNIEREKELIRKMDEDLLP